MKKILTLLLFSLSSYNTLYTYDEEIVSNSPQQEYLIMYKKEVTNYDIYFEDNSQKISFKDYSMFLIRYIDVSFESEIPLDWAGTLIEQEPDWTIYGSDTLFFEHYNSAYQDSNIYTEIHIEYSVHPLYLI